MKGLFDRINQIYFLWRWVVTQCWYKMGFGKIGAKSVFLGRIVHHNACGIEIGANVIIGPNCRLESYVGKGSRLPLLLICDGANIQHNVNIYAAEEVVIGKNALIASGCMITDNNHGIRPNHLPYVCQELVSAPTVIEEGVWLGEHVCVLAGCRVGRYSVVGSNSVVVCDVPPYSVAVGSPARVIKRYDDASEKWLPV